MVDTAQEKKIKKNYLKTERKLVLRKKPSRWKKGIILFCKTFNQWLVCMC